MSGTENGGRLIIAEKVAKKRGCVVVQPKDNELFLDIDGPDGWGTFRAHIKRLQEQWRDMTMTIRPSPSRKPYHYHVTITLPFTVTAERRVLLQCLLGSDLTRELLSFIHIEDGEEAPTIFFERPETPLLPVKTNT